MGIIYTSERTRERGRERTKHQEGKNSGIYIYGRNMCRTTYYIVVAHSGSNSRLDNEKNTHNSNCLISSDTLSGL